MLAVDLDFGDGTSGMDTISTDRSSPEYVAELKSDWDGNGCVSWRDPAVFFAIDLGAVRRVAGLTAQVDHNDDYPVEASAGGRQAVRGRMASGAHLLHAPRRCLRFSFALAARRPTE